MSTIETLLKHLDAERNIDKAKEMLKEGEQLMIYQLHNILTKRDKQIACNQLAEYIHQLNNLLFKEMDLLEELREAIKPINGN